MNRRKAFTLVELLAVTSIMVVVSALVIPALQTTKAALLFTSAARVSTMLDSARQTAIMTRQPVAVAMLPADANSVQRFAALKYSGSGSWTQISSWTSLPSGVLAAGGASTPTDSSGDVLNAFQPADSPKVSYALPSLSYGGTNYHPGSATSTGSTYYGDVIFLPDGSLYQDQASPVSHPVIPCIVRFVQGITDGNGGIKTYTNAGGAANYCDIVLNDATGQVKLVRP